MHKTLDSQYKTLAKYYCFDVGKYSMEEFFGDIKVFKDGFVVSSTFQGLRAKEVYIRKEALRLVSLSLLDFLYG